MNIKELYKLYQQHPCITTDSRNCPEGSIFLALKGASFDGNQYALSALEKGCAYAIIDNPEYKKDNRIILVDDCLQTFKDLAREHRRQFEIPVVGITGTNGKTTTKELIRAVLSECYNVMATEGNFNNDVGPRLCSDWTTSTTLPLWRWGPRTLAISRHWRRLLSLPVD